MYDRYYFLSAPLHTQSTARKMAYTAEIAPIHIKMLFTMKPSCWTSTEDLINSALHFLRIS